MAAKSSTASGKAGAASARPIAMITGASSGIGEALAQCFAEHGFDLVLVARSAEKLKVIAATLAKTYGIKAWVAPADLSEPEAAHKLAAAMRRARRPIEVLVNNAGVLEHGAFAAMNPQRHRQMIDLNISGLTQMVACFAPDMIKRGQGKILNVASIAAFQPIPSLATYAATKAYVLSFTESLSEEFKGTGVSITALCPGVTATNMFSTAKQGSSQLDRLPRFLIGDAKSVANEGFEACMRGEVIRVPGAINQASIIAGRATPKWLLRKVGGAMVRALG
jgi:uncharacterized protein